MSRPAIFLVSSAALTYEILLMRIFSIVEWHHFAWMVISLALLGYGASGTLLVLLGGRIERRAHAMMIVFGAGFGMTSVVCLAFAHSVPFNSLEIIWDPAQTGWLMLVYVLLAIPFFCAASFIAIALMTRSDAIHDLYRFDLLGAGAGALLGVPLGYLDPILALTLVSALAFGAACLIAMEDASLGRRRWLLASMLLVVLVVVVSGARRIRLDVSAYKELPQLLRVPGTKIVATRHTPLGRLDVVESPTVPLRHAPGLSLRFAGALPEQLALFSDAGGMSAIGRAEDDHAWLDFTTAALPYHVFHASHTNDRPSVTVIAPGGGDDVRSALLHGARRVAALEANRARAQLMREDLAAWTGSLYSDPAVDVRVGDARGYFASSMNRSDIIVLPPAGSSSGSSGGVETEDYIFTVESFRAMIRALGPWGYVAVSQPLDIPPRAVLRILTLAAVAIEAEGGRPAKRVIGIRNWGMVTLLVANHDVTEGEEAAARQFCQERSFDLAWVPSIGVGEANRFNVLDRPWITDGARALLSSPESRRFFIDRYKFDIGPVTDDRPYFSQFFLWEAFPELMRLRERGGAALVQWSYLVVVATFAQAVVAGVALILLPLFRLRRPRNDRRIARWRIGVFFGALGLGFLAIEIACMQRFLLLLQHPLIAIPVVLATFLVFAGLGSARAPRFTRHFSGRASAWITAGIAAVLALEILLFTPVTSILAGAPLIPRVMVTIVMIAPLAFLMGMPFPLGLERSAEIDPAWVPWGWGINGCASVVSAAGTALVAMHFGLTAVLGVAAALYVVAGRAIAPLEIGAGTRAG